MRERIEVYCDTIADFIWQQFQKDLEMSERVVAYVDKAFQSVYEFFRVGK
jgi:hypothetical protein